MGGIGSAAAAGQNTIPPAPAPMTLPWDFSGGDPFGVFPPFLGETTLLADFGGVVAPTGGSMAVLPTEALEGTGVAASITLPAGATTLRVHAAMAEQGADVIVRYDLRVWLLTEDGALQQLRQNEDIATTVDLGGESWGVTGFGPLELDVSKAAGKQGILVIGRNAVTYTCDPASLPNGSGALLINRIEIVQ